MAQPAKTKADMPAYGARGAPKFTGKGRQLEEFWERFEELAVACNVDEKERAALALRYVKKSRDKDLWKGMKNYKWVVLGDFEKWKDAVNGAYTDGEKKQEYTYSDLMRYVEECWDINISKEQDFMNYYRKFVSISQGLLSNGKIVEEQANRFFWQGLHRKTWKTIKKRLEVMDKDREANAIPSIEDALKAGQYVYSEKSFKRQYDGSGKRQGGVEEEKEGEEGKEKEREEVVTKRVVVEDPEKKRLDEIEELSARLRGMKVTEPAYAGLYTRLKV
ncbi:hypothetical protein FA15DRAFT_603930, partial [Coprinopsis marcescibilis]